MEGVRLNKYISDSGFCSRRMADEMIAQGRVTINGKDAPQVCLVLPGDKVAVDGEQLRTNKRAVYLALNKPVGITCTVDPEDKTNIADFVGYKERIYPIGRLDKPSQGLILLTNDGDIVNKILRAGNAHQKEYVVNVHKPLTEAFLNKMAAGVRLDKDTRTLPCKVAKMGESQFRVTLTQGLNRQIRRMCEAMGYNVTKLNRTRIMNITLQGLDTGQWRFLTTQEVEQLMAMTENSVKTHDGDNVAAGTRAESVKRYPSKSEGRVAAKSTGRSATKSIDKTTSKSPSRGATKSTARSTSKSAGGSALKSTDRVGLKTSARATTKPTSVGGRGDKPGAKSAVKPGVRSAPQSGAKSSAGSVTKKTVRKPAASGATADRPARKATTTRKPKTAYENYRSKGRTR